MADQFEELLDRVDQRIGKAESGEANSQGFPLAEAIRALWDLRRVVVLLHEQIVDLNSRVEHGYTHREVTK